MTCHHDFCENYMVLRPEDVSFLDLFLFLLSYDIKKRVFVEYPTGKNIKLNLDARILMSFSLSAQKIMLSLAKPMSICGLWFKWLHNFNFRKFFLNHFQRRGKEVGGPEISGVVDKRLKRVKLNKNIKPGDCKYYPALSVMASELSYKNKAFIQSTITNSWKMELIESDDYYNDFQQRRKTGAFILHDKHPDSDAIVVAFRGTEPFDAHEWCTDLDLSWYEFPGVGKIHGGFMKALGLQRNHGWPHEISPDPNFPFAYYTIRRKIKQILDLNPKTKLILTGHSLGGALAILFAAVLAMHGETELLRRIEWIYTFGQPKVGDEEFGRFMRRKLEEHGIKYLRFVYGNDVVPRLPLAIPQFLFKHFGTCLHFDTSYEGKILLGGDYVEGFPGLAAHHLQNYVNLTLFGSSDIYLQLARLIVV